MIVKSCDKDFETKMGLEKIGVLYHVSRAIMFGLKAARILRWQRHAERRPITWCLSNATMHSKMFAMRSKID